MAGSRCDEHAIGQATAPFSFRVFLRVGQGEASDVVRVPPLRIQEQTAALLHATCRHRARARPGA